MCQLLLPPAREPMRLCPGDELRFVEQPDYRGYARHKRAVFESISLVRYRFLERRCHVILPFVFYFRLTPDNLRIIAKA
jgi:hypothetical protein